MDKSRETTRKIGDGSAHWPRVPEGETLRDGWRAGVLLGLIAFLVLGLAGVLVMISRHAGGGR